MKKIKQLLAVFFAAVLMFTALPVSSVAVVSEVSLFDITALEEFLESLNIA